MAERTAPLRFSGLPPEGPAFYRALAADNSRPFWEAHRSVYDEAVKAPMQALADELEAEFGTFHLFRPHRDVRFSKDKRPYKDHQGMVTEGERGEMYYLQLDGEGVFVGSGMYRMAKDQLARYRQAVADDVAGPGLERIIASLERRYEIGGRVLTTAPRGFPRDHERVRLLQHKGVTAGIRLGAPAWLATRRTLTKVRAAWHGADDLHAWLGEHVGPSELAPDGFG